MHTYDREHRKAYSQNFVKNPAIIRYILSLVDIPAEYTVVEVGPGRGIITQELVKTHPVLAVEKDPELAKELQETLPEAEILTKDILKTSLPKTPYWVVSNPPFQIFSQLIKHILFAPNEPEGMLIFGQQEAVERIVGKTETSYTSVILNSFYLTDIPHTFARTDFTPVPGVEVVLLRATKIPTKLWQHKSDYERFVHQGFTAQKANLGKNLSKVFTFEQWKRLAKTFRFATTIQPADLSIDQWKGIFTYYRDHVDESKKV